MKNLTYRQYEYILIKEKASKMEKLMALISCLECNKQISDKSERCIQCGCPTSSANIPNADFDIQKQMLHTQQQMLGTQKQQLKIEKKQFKAMAKCPRCGSTSLSGNKKGFGLIKGAIGVAVAGPIGVLAAGIGKNKVKVTCMKCGKQFKA